jgi:flagellar biosynthesis/type III secretory pathway protein FliH
MNREEEKREIEREIERERRKRAEKAIQRAEKEAKEAAKEAAKEERAAERLKDGRKKLSLSGHQQLTAAFAKASNKDSISRDNTMGNKKWMDNLLATAGGRVSRGPHS